MATLGTTTEPTTSQEWFGLNTTNHFAVLLTMPSGGPWEISSLGAWLAGQSESCNFKLCIWSSGGTLLASSATLTAASMGFALGNNANYESAVGPIEVNGGAQVYVGFARDPADNVQFGTRSGSRAQWYSSGWPSSFGAWSSVSGAIGAYINDYHDANTAPNAPTSLNPNGNEVVSLGTAPVCSGTRSDPDSGDYITAYQIIVYEDNGTTVIRDSGKISVSGSPTTFARTMALNGSHKYVKWKARTWDKKGAAGPYTSHQRFYVNSVPGTPGAPTVDTDDLTPDISGSFTDSGDTLAAVQVEVTLGASPYTSKWSSGDIAKSGSSWTTTYAGSALAWGTSYRARYRVKDSHGAYSAWSAYKTWTPVQPVGPSNLTPRTTNPRLFDQTPDLTIGHSALFQNDEVMVRSVASDSGGTTMWSKTWDGVDYADVTSKVRTYAGTALAWGSTYYWKARVELADGTVGAWSAYYPFRLNAAPAAPTGLSPTGGVVLSTLTPTFLMTFADPDLDQGDTPLNGDLEIYNNATGALVRSVAASTVYNDGVWVYTGTPALAYETTYKWRFRFRDANGLEGPWSAYQVFKLSQPPAAALTAPASASVVIESTPTLDWTFSSPGGKTQYSYRVYIYDKGPTGANYVDEELVYDSGDVISTATSHDVPRGNLLDDHDYRWEVEVKDTDLLSYTLT